jgi:hypothetical protein
MSTYYCLLCGAEKQVKDTTKLINHCNKPMLAWKPGTTLEIVMFKDIALPDDLQRFTQVYQYTNTQKYTIYSVALEYLGDEHIDPLDRMYKAGRIAHWSCGNFSAEKYNV